MIKSFWWCNNLLRSILVESAVYFGTVPLSACFSVMSKCAGQSTVTKEVNVKKSCKLGTSEWLTSLVHPVQCEPNTYSSVQYRGEQFIATGYVSTYSNVRKKSTLNAIFLVKLFKFPTKIPPPPKNLTLT